MLESEEIRKAHAMEWQKIRDKFPHTWLVVEALDAYTENGMRVVPHFAVIDTFGDDWKAAWHKYVEMHRANRFREYYMLHTDRVELNIHVSDSYKRRAIP